MIQANGMAARRQTSAPSDDLIAEIDRVLGRTVRRIEAERNRIAYSGGDPEAGVTRTEGLLVDAMLGRLSLDQLADAVA